MVKSIAYLSGTELESKEVEFGLRECRKSCRSMGSIFPLSYMDGRMARNSFHSCIRASCGQCRKCCRVSLHPHWEGHRGEGLSVKSNCCCMNGRRSFFHLVMKSLFVKEREKRLELKQSQSTRSNE